MVENPPTIGLLDSGVGAITIFQKIVEISPFYRQVMIFDNAGAPYGSRPKQAVSQRIIDLAVSSHARLRFDALVVACNTASTISLAQLRQTLPIPIIGVVPAIKPATSQSRTGVIGLLATPSTIAGSYTDELIRSFGKGCRFEKLGSQRLVSIAEDKLRGIPPSNQILREILAPLFKDPQMDTVVLGCTHFPFLLTELQRAAPRKVRWVDSGKAVAKRVHQIIEPLASHLITPSHLVYLTKMTESISIWRQRFAPLGVRCVGALDNNDTSSRLLD